MAKRYLTDLSLPQLRRHLREAERTVGANSQSAEILRAAIASKRAAERAGQQRQGVKHAG
jgi:hypothetical protein